MNKVNNQRSKQTKQAFHRSMLAILSQGENVNSITVTEICKQAQLNRCTFYTHYQVPRDILDEIEAETYAEFITCFEALNRSDDVDKLADLLTFIRAKKETYYILFTQKENTAFTEKIINTVLNALANIDQFIIDKRLTPYLYGYMIHGGKNIIVSWIESDFDVDEKTLANMIYTLCKKSVETFMY